MKAKYLYSIVLLALVLLPVSTVQAQQTEPMIFDTTTPIGPELTDSIVAWLKANQPASTPYYVVTYVQSTPTGTYVCLAGLVFEGEELPDEWNIEKHGAWFGTIKIDPTGEIRLFAGDPRYRGQGHLASLSPAAAHGAGGGSYLRFPWEAEKNMLFGMVGIHNRGDFGFTELWSINFTSGDDLGSNMASNAVLAVDDGVIDWVCADNFSTAIRTHNDTTSDDFVYGHLLDNDNLIINNSFEQGEEIGRLRYGTFPSLGCGEAFQRGTVYNLFFMFLPENVGDDNYIFTMEACTLKFKDILTRGFDAVFVCGGKTIEAGGSLLAHGTAGPMIDDPNITQTPGWGGLSFFDMIVGGGIQVWASGIVGLFPESSSAWTFRDNVINTVLVVIKLVKVLITNNFNLSLFVAVISFILLIEASMFALRIFGRVTATLAKVLKFII